MGRLQAKKDQAKADQAMKSQVASIKAETYQMHKERAKVDEAQAEILESRKEQMDFLKHSREMQEKADREVRESVESARVEFLWREKLRKQKEESAALGLDHSKEQQALAAEVLNKKLFSS